MGESWADRDDAAEGGGAHGMPALAGGAEGATPWLDWPQPASRGDVMRRSGPETRERRVPPEEVTLRVGSTGPLADFARDHRAHVTLWCNGEREVLRIELTDAKAVEALARTLVRDERNFHLASLGDVDHILALPCLQMPHDRLLRLLSARVRSLLVPPVLLEGATVQVEVLSLDPLETTALVAAVHAAGFRVEASPPRPLFAGWHTAAHPAHARDLAGALTLRQAKAVLLAANHGLYNSPRGTTAAEIARAQHISRSTFEEHLRKAENKLLSRAVPLLRARVRGLRRG